MAFHEVQLATDISRSAVGGPRFKTNILALSSGHEQRNIEWSVTRGEWDIGYSIRSQADLDILIKFFYAREGRAHGFRFKDWSDFKIGDTDNPTTDNQSIGTGDNSDATWQIFKRYTSGGINYDRNINKIVTSKIAVLLDDVLKSDPGDYSINLNTGLITFVSAPGSSVDIGVACEFDVPVRFDIDEMRLNIIMVEIGSWPNIPVVEVRV